MATEDKRISELTQISSAPSNGVLPIDVPGNTETNGITINILAKRFTVFNSLTFTKDANDLVETGCFENTLGNLPDWDEYKNYPTGYGMFIVFAGSYFVLQLVADANGNVFCRTRINETDWSQWMQISFT